MVDVSAVSLDDLDPALGQVIRAHREKVLGWLKNEPGCWGFLAGKAVAAIRQETGRSLTDAERRLVWDRLWWLLENIKREVNG
ncbi:MAG TPA: hypothetical protein VFA32_04150 [Dehalococcoidia bacterium]|jgi:hypothetical protein|nr:hypothetical protein [Dehalococcoidia bacterium]